MPYSPARCRCASPCRNRMILTGPSVTQVWRLVPPVLTAPGTPTLGLPWAEAFDADSRAFRRPLRRCSPTAMHGFRMGPEPPGQSAGWFVYI
jgi:hypothetical protein